MTDACPAHCAASQVTFLPLLQEPCSFDLLVYTNQDAQVPQKWYDSDPRYIMNSQEVKLRSFTTTVRATMRFVCVLRDAGRIRS